MVAGDQGGGFCRAGKDLQAGFEMLGVCGLNPAHDTDLPVCSRFTTQGGDVADGELAHLARDVHDGITIGALVDDHPLGFREWWGVRGEEKVSKCG